MRTTSGVLASMSVAALLLAALPGTAAGEAATPLDLTALVGSVAQQDPAVAFDGTHHLLVWEESAVVWGAMLDDAGAVVQAPFVVAPPANPSALQATPSVAASASGLFLVAWAEDPDGGGDWNVRAARVSAAGAVLDASGFDVSVVLVDGVPSPAPPPVSGAQVAPAVAAIADEFLVVWEDHRDPATAPDVFGSAVAADGTVLDQGGLAISRKAGAQQHPAVASDGAEYLVAWEDSGAGTLDVYGARVSGTGAIGGELAISTAAADQVGPCVAASDAGWAVAWADSRSGTGWSVVATRVSATGVSDPGGIVIATTDAGAPVAVASDGTGYLLAYERAGVGALARRLGADGVPGASELTLDATGVVSPGLAVAPSGFEQYLAIHRQDVSGVAQLAGTSVYTAEPLEVVVQGGGVVTSAPAGIACGPTCTAWFETGTSVTLTASPDSSSEFAGWTGCPAATGPSCTLTLLAPATVTASFSPALPGAPAGLASSGVGETSMTLSWAAASNATGYELERAPDEGGTAGTFALLWSGTATSHLDTGLSANTAWWYRVRATNAAGAGDYGSWISARTLPGAPGAPTVSDVTATSVTVSWTAPDGGAAGYELERASASGADWTRVATVASLTHVDTSVADGTGYQYRVRATNVTGAGAFSASVPVTTLLLAPDAPAAPTFSAIGATSVTVSWAAVSGAETYDLERAAVDTGPWTVVAAGVTGTSHVDGTLSTATTWWFRVRAVNAGGASPFSGASSVLTLPGAPGAPTFSSVSTTSLTLGWPPVTGAASYRLERSTAGGPWVEIASGLVTTSHADATLTANTAYAYRVRATNSSGDGAPSPEASATTLPVAPGAPSFTGITISTLTVSWLPPSGGAASYELDRSTSGTGDWTTLATGTTATSFADTGLAAGTTYWYRVRAANGSGGWSTYATSSVPTLPDAPAAPTFSSVTEASLTVIWPAVTGATGYRLERAPDVSGAPGTWAQIAQVAAPSTSFADSGRTANTTYWYRVRATNGSGDGAYSPHADVTMLANPPGAPTYTAVTTSTVTVSWQPPSGGAASYDLDRSTGAAADWTALAVATTATSFADSGLAAGTTYSYRVRAANADGVKTAYATSSVVMLPDAPPAPTFSSIEATSLTVAWGTVTGATGYELERAPDVSGAPGTWTPIATPALASHGDSGLAANSAYWYRVRATNASGAGTYSPQAGVMTAPNAPPKPTFSLVTATTLTVSWTAPDGGAASYDVERAPSATGPWTEIATGVPGLSLADAGLAAGMSYAYRIRAANTAGTRGAWSLVASVTTVPGAPGAPTFSEVSAYSLTVQWEPIPGATTYHLERTVDASGQPDAFAWQVIAAGLLEPWYNDAVDAPGTTYWYRVRGANEDGHASEYGDYSPASSVTTLATPPGAPTFTSVGVDRVTLAWSAPSGPAPSSYDLQRATSSSGPWTSITVAGQSYTDTGLAPGTTYWYRVAARNVAGQPGLYSTSRAVTTLTDAPAAPTLSGVTATSVTVTWTATSGATSYRLERSTGSTNSWSSLGGAVQALGYTDGAAAPNTTYWYRVSALNAAGAPGPYSPAASVTTLPGAPGAPAFTNVAATTLTVSWTPPAGGAASYRLERAMAAVGPWTSVASGLAATSHGDSGLLAGTTYHYRVLALNAAGAAGLPSAARAITTGADVTTAPGPIASAPTFSSVSATSVRVSWTQATNATSYELERAVGSGAWTVVANLAGTGYTDAGRSPNTLHRYRVRGVNAAGQGPSSPEGSVLTAPGAPATPTFTALAATSVTVLWTEPAGGAASYTLERAPSRLGPWTVVASGLAATTHADSALSGNTTYHYRVRAANAAGLFGTWSPPGSVTTPPDATAALPGAPGAPTFSFVTATSLRVGWTAASGAASYAVERSTSELAGWAQIAAVTGMTLADSGRAPNTTYWYRVRASNAGGFGPYSPARSVVTAPNVPGAPQFSSVATTSVTVSWAPPSGGAASYELERAPGASGPWTVLATVAPTYVDSGLSGNTTYHYRVRAKNAAGVLSLYSATRYVTTAPDAGTAVPGAPGAPTYTDVSASAVRVLWAPALGATSYELERAPAGVTGPGVFAPIATGLTTTAYRDIGRAANTRYWYRVRGVGAGGKGPYSSPSSVLTAPGAPGAPAFGGVTSATLVVTWTAPSGGAASYKVERAPASFGPWALVASGVPTTSFSDSGLRASTVYWYRIRATNAEGRDGVVSPSRSTLTAADAATPIAGAPGAPAFTTVRATSVDLAWTPGTDATSYEIDRAVAETGPFTQVAVATGTAYGDAPLGPNTSYWYRVRSVNAAGDGGTSPAASVMTAPGAPGAPTLSVTGTTVTVGWTAPAGGADSYAVERAADPVGPWTELATGVTALSYDDSGLAAGTAYYYRVRAANAEGRYGGYSVVRSVTTAPAPGM